MQQSPVILDLCLRKIRAGKSRDYRDVIVLKMFSVHMNPKGRAGPGFSNSSGLKRIFGKLRFRDGLVWTLP